MKSERLDNLIVQLGLSQSREKAKALIIAGEILVDGQKVFKPSETFSGNANIELVSGLPFVSRAGVKLKKALDCFKIDLTGAVAADIGASTGGFTDCMLQHGARKVYAIDVGYGQLDWKLRSDPRVVVLDRSNARFIEKSWFEDELCFASMDVSFISVKLILPPLLSCLQNNAQLVILIKPQFEAGKDLVGKKGVVRDKSVHVNVIRSVLEFAVSKGYQACGLDFSPIKGPSGNIEFLLWLKVSSICEYSSVIDDFLILEVVESAHNQLNSITK